MTVSLAPDPLDVLSSWGAAQPQITAICGTRISDKLVPNQVYPAIRMADLGPAERDPGEWAWRVQVECWADTYKDARDLARTLDALVLAGTLRGTWAGSSCSGGRVAPGPFASPDPASSRYRFILTVELWLYAATV